MNLILFDELNQEECDFIKTSKASDNAVFFNLNSVEVSNLNNYNYITIYCGLTLNFVSRSFILFIENLCGSRNKKLQINVIFVEKLGENAKIAIDWLNLLNEHYSFNIKILSELDRDNLALDLNLISNKLMDSQPQKDNNVTIYTDGACSGNPGAGGWGAILFHGNHKKEISGFENETTNNRMEITAVIRALEMLKASCHVELYSDSAYVVNAIKLGWLENWKANGFIGSDKKPVKNIEYWKRLDELMQVHDVNFNKVKGHSDNEFNNRCDQLATGEIAKHANDDI